MITVLELDELEQEKARHDNITAIFYGLFAMATCDQ